MEVHGLSSLGFASIRAGANFIYKYIRTKLNLHIESSQHK